MKICKYTVAVWITLASGLICFSGVQPQNSASKGKMPASRTITDMAGRRVKVPAKITKVLCTAPPLVTAAYIVAPDKLGALFGTPSKENSRYMPEKYRSIPVIGWGRNRNENYEEYIAANPDIIFDGCGRIGGEAVAGDTLASVNIIQEKVGAIPVVCIDSDLSKYDEIFRFMGDVLGVQARTNALIAYHRNVQQEVKAKTMAIPKAKRTRVYYAEGADGLQTNPTGSRHAMLIEFCGGENVVGSGLIENRGSQNISVTKESLLLWNPAVIITGSSKLIDQMYRDDTWKEIGAVKNHRIHRIPSKPYNWFDRPPGANRIVGIPWLAHIFYPNLFSDAWFRKKAKEFYKLFYSYDLSDGELASLLAP